MRTFTALTLSLLVVGASLRAAKPAQTDTPVTVTLRCAVVGDRNPDASCPSSTSPDRIQGDPAGPYVGNATTGLGAFLTASGNDLALKLSDTRGQLLGLTISMDFRSPYGLAACISKKNCRRVAPYFFDVATTDQSPFGDLVNPVDASGVDLPNGLLSIPIGTSANANMKVNFPDPFGRTLTWTVRFNPVSYPGSSYVTVTRTADGAWVVEASATSLAKLVASPSGDTRNQTDEGLFYMPFRMTVVK